MKTRTSKLQSVSQIFQDLPIQNNLSLCFYLSKNWPAIVGKDLAESLQPVGYKQKSLWIRVPSSCHIQEMTFHTQKLITQINQALGQTMVQEIRWTI